VTLNKDSQLGVNWNAVLNPKNYTGLLPDALGVVKPSIGMFTGQSSNPNLDPSKGSFSYGISNGKVGVILDALANQGKLRVLSNPRISTLNNQKAMIRVVREEVYFTLNSMASQNLGPTITTQNVINQVVPIGVVLDILPQIGNDGEITLSVNPSISELVEVRTFTSANGQAVSTQPVIDRRDLDTVAKVKSGQTILIAGIIRERKGDSMRGVPGLMHMPLLGPAFRRTEVSTARTELVMFITPTLMSGKAIDELSQQERDNIDQLEKKFDVLKKKGK
jgi:MSHA biogenesis protein MshL